MTDTAIQIVGLGKQYRIGAQKAMYRTLRETLTDTAIAPLRAAKRLVSRSAPARNPNQTFWALRDVTFDVKKGEVIGIIGQNGAGKSTLLKILSRITEPTEGYADIEGRVGSLLEVGTGFHGELSGRENTYLNGAILGMKRSEIDRKFDEIVAFAEVEKFIDTPVKHYSSGMYLRLAFAVAAHLEPEILIVDEVLAVGDAAFQRKCMGKMSEVAGEGRTVLFVSHNMGAIMRLCKTAALLHKGQLMMTGETQTVVQSYLDSTVAVAGEVRFETPGRVRSELAFSSVCVKDREGRISSTVPLSNGAMVEAAYRVTKPLRGDQIMIRLWNSEGVCILSTTDHDDLTRAEQIREPGEYLARCHIPRDFLRPGSYWLDVIAHVPGIRFLDDRSQAIGFEVIDDGSIEGKIGHARIGVVAPLLNWEVAQTS